MTKTDRERQRDKVKYGEKVKGRKIHTHKRPRERQTERERERETDRQTDRQTDR